MNAIDVVIDTVGGDTLQRRKIGRAIPHSERQLAYWSDTLRGLAQLESAAEAYEHMMSGKARFRGGRSA